MFTNGLLATFAITSALIIICTAESSLRLVLMIHRHGDRNPIKSYPKDPFKDESNWPDGLGELRPEGKRRLYDMGVMLKTRYDGFLTDNPREVHVRSSAADRCLESVASLLAGCYPPSGRWIWNEKLHWQPFPIQTKPRPVDGMLNPGSNCPAAEIETQRIRSSPEVTSYSSQFKKLFEFLRLNTGANVSNIWDVENLHDVLFIEKLSGHTLPSWVSDSLLVKLGKIRDRTFYFDYSTKLIQRLRTGLLLKDIISRLKYTMTSHDHELLSTEGLSKKKFYLYSSHDTQVAATLQALNSFNMLAPPYGSSIIIELHERRKVGPTTQPPIINEEQESSLESKYVLKMFYWNETKTADMIELTVPGCDNSGACPVTKFIESTNAFIPEDWSKECSLSFVDRFNSAMVQNLLMVSLLGFTSLVLLAIVYNYLKRPKDERSHRVQRSNYFEDDNISSEALETGIHSVN